MDKPRLAGGGPDARIALHPLHQQLEVADRQVQIHVQFAQGVEGLQAHRLQAGVEGLNDAWAYLPTAAIGAPHDAEVGQAAGVLLEDGRSLVGRSAVYDHPKRWQHRLCRYAVERAAQVLRLVPAGRDEQIASRGGHVGEAHWRRSPERPYLLNGGLVDSLSQVNGP